MKHSADDKSLQAFWVNSSVLLLESERRPGESRAEGTAFTLLQEGDTHVSDALEHSDRLRRRSSLMCRKCRFTVRHVHMQKVELQQVFVS